MCQKQAIQHFFIGRRGDALKVVLDAGRQAALAVVGWHQRRKAIRELMALDDRTLRDINVRRDASTFCGISFQSTCSNTVGGTQEQSSLGRCTPRRSARSSH